MLTSILMKNYASLFILSLLFFWSCQHQSSSTSSDRQGTENSGPALAEAPEQESFCYAAKTKAQNSVGEQQYNYEFMRLKVGKDNRVEGAIHIYYYGTDAMVGSLAGIYKRESNEIQTEATLLAEGSRYKEPRDYRLLDKAVDLGYTDSNGQAALLPMISCEEYDELFRESQLSRLRNLINTTDRSRLLKAKAIKARGYTEDQLNNVRFLERAVDLDHDYETQEYLLYVIDPTYCGSGGCELLVIDDKGETLSSISAVKLPVYTLFSTAEENQTKKGVWKELFVNSQGLRRLVPVDGKYPANASDEPIASEELMTDHPEHYLLLLDFLD